MSFEYSDIGIAAPDADQELVKDFLKCMGADMDDVVRTEKYIPDLIYGTFTDDIYDTFACDDTTEMVACMYATAKMLFGENITAYYEHRKEIGSAGYWKIEEITVTPNAQLHYYYYEYCCSDMTGIGEEPIVYLLKDQLEKLAKEQGIKPEWETEQRTGQTVPAGEFEYFCDMNIYDMDITDATTIEKTIDISEQKIYIDGLLEAAQYDGYYNLIRLIKERVNYD